MSFKGPSHLVDQPDKQRVSQAGDGGDDDLHGDQARGEGVETPHGARLCRTVRHLTLLEESRHSSHALMGPNFDRFLG